MVTPFFIVKFYKDTAKFEDTIMVKYEIIHVFGWKFQSSSVGSVTMLHDCCEFEQRKELVVFIHKYVHIIFAYNI